MNERRVVVTGLGVVAPNANNVPEFKDALFNHKSGIIFHEELKELKFGCQVGGVPKLDESVIKEKFSEEELLTSSQILIFGGLAAMEAYNDAGFEVPKYDSQEVQWDTGAIIGTGLGSVDVVVHTIVPQVKLGKVRRLGSSIVENTMCSSISAKVGGLLALGNNVTTNSSACTTGLEAVIQGYTRIKFGLADKMITGGVEICSPYLWGGFDAMRVLNVNSNEDPEKASRPMSASANGFIPGSGAGILFLEELESAKKRGVRIYAEILGATLNSGGHRLGGSMTAPNSTGVQKNIQSTLKMSKINPKDIDYINGHLTATFADTLELNNWSKALGVSPSDFPYVNSTKSLIGHSLGAAGSIESIATILQLRHGFLHKSLNCEDLHPDIQDYKNSIVRETIQKDISIAMKASFGFGDVNGSLIFKRV